MLTTTKTKKVKALMCDVCGESGAQLRYVTRSYGKGANLLIIENVPIVVCPHCGESCLTAETLHEIERIKNFKLQTSNLKSPTSDL
ncbi:MAG: type II toxin-antitoxin system MqsA family antitoxin [Chloroflexota bacterium]